MSKRTVFTHVTPLPGSISRETAVAFLHDHIEMIEMNPLVIRHERTSAPPNATKDEFDSMTWYELTDEIQYIPGTAVKGQVSYKAGFYDLPKGLQTHCFAPGGVDIQGKWSVGGNMPGEEKETWELGIDKPRDGLYLREDVDLKCNVFLASFVKRNLRKSHGVLVEKLVKKADKMEKTKSPSAAPVSAQSEEKDSRKQERNSLVAPLVPHKDSDQTSYASQNPTPLSTHSVQLSKPVCSCLGTRHHPACRFYIDIYQEPVVSPTESHTSQTSKLTIQPTQPHSALPPPRTSSWATTPTSNYGSSRTFDTCHCSGGVHIKGCSLYPGLRPVPRSRTPTEPIQYKSYQHSRKDSYSKPIPPDPRRTRSRDGSSSRQQMHAEQAEPPGEGSLHVTNYEKGWPEQELKPQRLMTRTAHGHAVIMELEGDPALAQRYYEFQAQRVAQPPLDFYPK